jgi:heme oxygenase (mycobilin-producing)
MSRRLRVLVYVVSPADEPNAVEVAYHRISQDLAGTPGLIGNELLRSVYEPLGFLVMSEWESLAAFRAWEQSSGHRRKTAPLRPYQDRRGTFLGIYEVTAAYSEYPGR